MSKVKIYRDSKELTARVYERIETTGDYFFMIKGYEQGDEVNYDINELEQKFKEVVQDYIVSINNKSLDFENLGLLHKANNDILVLNTALELLMLQSQINELSARCGIEPENIIKDALIDLKIPKSDDLLEQQKHILNRLKKIDNDVLDISSKLQLKESESPKEKISISDIVVTINVGLSLNIDMDKTSIYQIGRYIEMLVKKNEHSLKNNKDGG
jgi:hypothetical protein